MFRDARPSRFHRGGRHGFFGESCATSGKIFCGPSLSAPQDLHSADGPKLPAVSNTADRFTATTVALGFHIQGTNEQYFYARKGSLFEATRRLFDGVVGVANGNTKTTRSSIVYREVGRSKSRLTRKIAQRTKRALYDLCMFGVNRDRRGYTAGEFQNDECVATQAEYRRELKGRFRAGRVWWNWRNCKTMECVFAVMNIARGGSRLCVPSNRQKETISTTESILRLAG